MLHQIAMTCGVTQTPTRHALQFSKDSGHIQPPSGAVAYAIMTSFNGATTFNSTSLIHLKLNRSGTPSDPSSTPYLPLILKLHSEREESPS